MMVRVALVAVMCSVLSACRNEAPAPPVDTGSRQVVTIYFESLAAQDWDRAYAQLHPDSQKRFDRKAFEHAARGYGKRLGFPLGKVTIRSCDEQGEKAVAQVILGDAAGSMKHRFQEGMILRRSGDAWRVMLPTHFGSP